MRLGFNEANDRFCQGHTVMQDLELCEKYGFDYTIEASLTVGSNPAASTTEPYEVVKGILNIPFAVNIAYHYDEMAQLSDILLASNSVLERESVNCFEGSFDISTIETNNQRLMMYRDPLPPIYNTRQPQDIIIELCELRRKFTKHISACCNFLHGHLHSFKIS